MLEIIVKNGQLHFNIEDNSLLLKKYGLAFVVELAEGLYMMGKLIISNMTVVREVNIDISMGDAMKVPQFDMEKLPFIIAIPEVFDSHTEFVLINIKTGTVQKLVKAIAKTKGFCVSLDDGTFDFHFSHKITDKNDLEKKQEQHHRMCFRKDLIQFLSENG